MMHNLNLHRFVIENLFTASEALFEQLGFALTIRSRNAIPLHAALKEYYQPNALHAAITETYFLGAIDDTAHFVKTSEDIDQAVAQVEQASANQKYNGLLLFALKAEGYRPTRTEIAHLTRAFNRRSRNVPVVVIVRYDQDEQNYLAFATSERLPYQQTWRPGEKIGKISMLKDIDLNNPHTAHQLILWNLSLHRLREKERKLLYSFDELYESWRQTLDTKELNKRFFQELANWYFWASGQAAFPDDLEKNPEIRNATNLIRLLTRVIFIWFIKEKALVPPTLFDKQSMHAILKDFLASDQSATYYQAILQNLFFATLNQPMDKRAFAKEGAFAERKSEYGVKTLFRYADQFRIAQDAARALFADIPFLNGGLFDCLDKENEHNKVIYVDGFSRNPQKRAHVPDFLFFAPQERDVDLTRYYDPTAKKPILRKVRGLFDILNSYKFTVAENTPIEEEVALDPELLGKVFENLLASYNPETQTTARKQTGSFYTPREIVNYMVDESLCAYLKQALLHDAPGVAGLGTPQTDLFGNSQRKGQLLFEHKVHVNRWVGKENELDHALQLALAYTESPLPFDADDRQRLIAAINRAKILDPACGSGAFPMGVLHKLVHLLHKLDPDNRLWKHEQKEKIIGEKVAELTRDQTLAAQLSDEKVREQAQKAIEDRLREIEEIFDREHNLDDYARKLYLIENCIYGVDIQPIAVQIAKLRCFISLIIDQKKQPGRENLGIRALPNLETKFVAANTLIGFSQQIPLKTQDVLQLEAALKQVRHRHFTANTRHEKLACQKQDHALRATIAERLQAFHFSPTDAQMLSDFDLYDQNASAKFFDPAWMFGLQDGFDIVIGNPPYVSLSKIQKKQGLTTFKTYENTSDLYCLFYEKSNVLLRTNGILSLITSNQWLQTNYGKRLRKYFVKHLNPLKLLNFGGFRVFESATVDTNVFISRREACQHQLWACYFKTDYTSEQLLEDYFNAHKIILTNLDNDKWTIAENAVISLKEKLKQKGEILKNWNINIYRGLLTGLNEAFIIDTAQKDVLCSMEAKCAEIMRPILRGRDVHKYSINWAGLWLITAKNGIDIPKKYPAIYEHLQYFGDQIKNRADQGEYWWNLRACSYYDDFEKEKIIYPETTVRRSEFYLDRKQFYVDKTCFMITGEYLSYLNAVLSSRLMEWYLETELRLLGKKSIQYSKQYIENIPIPRIPVQEQKPFEVLVDQILAAKQRDSAADTRALEADIDQLVYALYGLTAEEIALVEGAA